MSRVNKKIVGYSDVLSVRPNHKISFMISCDKKIKYIYSKFVKLIQGDCNPDGPGFKEEKIIDYANYMAMFLLLAFFQKTINFLSPSKIQNSE